MKTLKLSSEDKKIAGVCAAFARSFDLDVTLVRIIWACCVVIGGFGILAYIICWLVIPNDNSRNTNND